LQLDGPEAPSIDPDVSKSSRKYGFDGGGGLAEAHAAGSAAPTDAHVRDAAARSEAPPARQIRDRAILP
jgi:hypothetical protein